MNDILEQLPDARATQRLLSALGKLEKAFNASRQGSAQAAASSAEIKQLREENLSLKFRQKKARERLDKLMTKLPGLFPELSGKNTNEEAA